MRFCTITPVYNEMGDHLRKNLDSQEKLGVERAYFPDGCWHKLMDSKSNQLGLSYDGTRDLIRSYKFTRIIDCGWWGEIKTINESFRKAASDGYDFVIQLAADEWLEGDYERFKANCIESLDEDKNMFWLKFITHHITPPSQKFDKLARVIYNPMFVRLRHIHWWYFVANLPVNYGSQIRGLEIHHDDTPRPRKREDDMLRFQKWQEKNDRDIINKLNKAYVPKPIITKYPCGCEDGVEFFWARGGVFGRDVRIKCPKHTMILKV